MPASERYRTFTISKRGGSSRTIDAPCTQIKLLQEALLYRLNEIYVPRVSVHGFTSGRSIVTNARRHVGCRWLLNIDLQDFFPSIHVGRIIGLFRAPPFSCEKEAAVTLAQICTLGGRLPQGAPTSPIISNMICFKMDRQILELAKAHRCTYTRYADDITVSTRLPDLPPVIVTQHGGALSIGEELSLIIASARFQINAGKVRLQHHSHRLVVTGLKVNRFPNVRRRLISQIRAMLHAWKKFGLRAADAEFAAKYDVRSRSPFSPPSAFRHVLLGKLLFLGQVRGFSDKRFTEFASELYELDPTLLPKSPTYAVSQLARAATCVLTNDDESKTATGFFLHEVGLITCHHVAEWATQAFYPDALGDRYSVTVLESKPEADLAICKTDLPARYELMPYFPDLRNGTGVFLHGFPQYNPGFPGQFQQGQIIARRNIFGCTRYIVSMRIVAGNSGGPLLNAFGRLVGVAITGDVDQEKGYSPADYAAIPIRYLNEFAVLRPPKETPETMEP
jgi:RNA-directed DNA polymerase